MASQAEVIPLLLNILEISFAPSRKSPRVEVSGISFSKGSRGTVADKPGQVAAAVVFIAAAGRVRRLVIDPGNFSAMELTNTV